MLTRMLLHTITMLLLTIIMEVSIQYSPIHIMALSTGTTVVGMAGGMAAATGVGMARVTVEIIKSVAWSAA